MKKLLKSLENQNKDTVLCNMIKFQINRDMHKQKFNVRTASLNIIEELFEAHGINDECKERKAERKELLYNTLIKLVNEAKLFNPEICKTPTKMEQVDAFCDICEFAIGEPLKLGYNPIIALDEMQKEINSREGEIVNGKFEKHKTEEAMSKWYVADYNKALFGESFEN